MPNTDVRRLIHEINIFLFNDSLIGRFKNIAKSLGLFVLTSTTRTCRLLLPLGAKHESARESFVIACRVVTKSIF